MSHQEDQTKMAHENELSEKVAFEWAFKALVVMVPLKR